MSRSYSQKTFIRNVSKSKLKKYFSKRQMLAGFDWSLEGDAFVEALNQAIEGLPNTQSALVEQDFDTIHDYADEDGILNLLDVVQTRSENPEKISLEMMKNEGDFEKALWFFLECPDEFEWALRLEQTESMKFNDECAVGKGHECSLDEEAIADFKSLIQKYYKKQKRGRNCHIDHYIRQNPTRYLIFAYPEDYAKRDLTYKGSKLVPDVRRPVIEIVFIYEPETGILRLSAGKMRNAEIMLEAFCKAILGLPGIPDGSTKVYDLTPLMDPNFRFVTDPKHPIESVSLKMLSARIKEIENQKLTFEGEPLNGGAELVRSMMTKAAKVCGVTHPEKIKPQKAKISIVFAKTGKGRKPVATFILSLPGRSTLENKPHHHIAKEYVEKWGLTKLLFPKEDEAA